jgi:RNA polymerase sigma factor (sigma-70 family)
MLMSDQQLIELIRNRQTSIAFRKLYRYFPVVQKKVLAFGGTREDAQDIYQDALVILFRKLQEEGFTLTSSLNTYLYGICSYLWRDLSRKRRKEPGASLYAEEEVSFVAGDFAERELLDRLALQAVESLGGRCREILRLFYIEALSMAKIAGKLGFSSEKVAKNQKYKCLETAKNHLRELKKKADLL